LEALVEELGMKSDRVAAELNREIVPRESWKATALKDGDRLEIVHFVAEEKRRRERESCHTERPLGEMSGLCTVREVWRAMSFGL